MELSTKDTKMLQGLSVLAMVWLHLFDRSYEGVFQPLVFFQGVPLSFYIAQLCDFCVFGFAFCSGYGHYAQFHNQDFYKKRLKGLLSVFCSYWLIMLLFSVAAICLGQGAYMPGSIRKFAMNALTLENSYNGAWWYLFTYAVLVLLSPLLMKLVERVNPVMVLTLGFVVYCAAYYVRFKITGAGWLLGKLGPFGMTLFEYLIGAECCKQKVLSRLHIVWEKVQTGVRYALAAVLIAAMLYVRTKIVPSLFAAPVTGAAVMMLFHFWKKPKWVQKGFLFVGQHSTNIWLTHMFFYAVLFKNFVYVAKYPLPIFGLMMGITVALSMLLQLVEKPIRNKIAAL